MVAVKVKVWWQLLIDEIRKVMCNTVRMSCTYLSLQFSSTLVFVGHLSLT